MEKVRKLVRSRSLSEERATRQATPPPESLQLPDRPAPQPPKLIPRPLPVVPQPDQKHDDNLYLEPLNPSHCILCQHGAAADHECWKYQTSGPDLQMGTVKPPEQFVEPLSKVPGTNNPFKTRKTTRGFDVDLSNEEVWYSEDNARTSEETRQKVLEAAATILIDSCLLYTSPSPRD